MVWVLRPILPPNPAIDRQNTYLYYSGKKLRPGKYVVLKGSTVKMHITVLNKRGFGAIRCIVWDDASKKAIADKRWQNIRQGQRVTLDVPLKVDKSYSLRVLTYYFLNGRWIKYDEYGC